MGQIRQADEVAVSSRDGMTQSLSPMTPVMARPVRGACPIAHGFGEDSPYSDFKDGRCDG
jgi:hypothetical protein